MQEIWPRTIAEEAWEHRRRILEALRREWARVAAQTTEAPMPDRITLGGPTEGVFPNLGLRWDAWWQRAPHLDAGDLTAWKVYIRVPHPDGLVFSMAEIFTEEEARDSGVSIALVESKFLRAMAEDLRRRAVEPDLPSAPAFAKPLAPLADWLKEVDGVIAGARRG